MGSLGVAAAVESVREVATEVVADAARLSCHTQGLTVASASSAHACAPLPPSRAGTLHAARPCESLACAGSGNAAVAAAAAAGAASLGWASLRAVGVWGLLLGGAAVAAEAGTPGVWRGAACCVWPVGALQGPAIEEGHAIKEGSGDIVLLP